jgi:hypothetical protein
MSKCDGKGTCVPQGQSCGNYKCTADGVRCRASCAVDNDCASNAFCQDTFCLPKLPVAAVCSRSEQCASSLCGGRCCKPGEPCKCTQPSAGNLLANPGFDKDLSGWVTANASWVSADSDNCPFSGALKSPSNSGEPTQMIPIKEGVTYNVGGRFSAYEGGATYRCDVNLFSTSSYLTSVSVFGSLGAVGTWVADSATFTAPADSTSAQLQCEIYTAYVDQLFLTVAPGKY